MSIGSWWRARKHKWPWITGGAVLVLVIIAGLSGNPSGGGADRNPVAGTASLVTIPNTLVGKSPAQAKAELAALGFHDVQVESVDGRHVIVESNWQVVSVAGTGSAVSTSTRVVLRVDKPGSATTTTVAPPVEEKRTTTAAPPAVPVRTTVPEPEPEPAAEPAYYRDCAAARAAGAAPLHQGEPGYRSALDRDHDGVACES